MTRTGFSNIYRRFKRGTSKLSKIKQAVRKILCPRAPSILSKMFTKIKKRKEKRLP